MLNREQLNVTFTTTVEIIVKLLLITTGAGQGMFFSPDTKVRDSSELALCPSAADSFEFLLVSLVLLEEEVEDDDE